MSAPTISALDPNYLRTQWDRLIAEERQRRCETHADLQAACESWLQCLGYVRCTARNAEAYRDRRVCGWFWHLHNTRENPFQPDIVMIAEPATRPPLLVELKVERGVRIKRIDYRPGQREMIEAGRWACCLDAARFLELVREWEAWNAAHDGRQEKTP